MAGIKLKKLFDEKFFKFILIGVINTIVGTAIMFGLYNIAKCSYWFSSAANYILTSILSYILNKSFTFKNKEKGIQPILKFGLNILVCYLLAYGLAKPLVKWILADQSQVFRDNAAMFAGMVFFTGFNYLGQRFFAFKVKADDKRNLEEGNAKEK